MINGKLPFAYLVANILYISTNLLTYVRWSYATLIILVNNNTNNYTNNNNQQI